jgi:2-polyprenyl-6-hydroxyphenyl methylase / 3-demethylubiquinone-9 3-methyltransferase
MNVDTSEIAQFDRFAGSWWDLSGDFRTLHAINPVRLEFVSSRCELNGAKVLDVGCGGGIFSEALSAAGGIVTGIDLAPLTLDTARAHALESGLEIDYLEISVEALAAQRAGYFDVISCMEMLEHVPDPQAIVAACAALLKPGGWLFLSTVNRTPKSFAMAIVGAEYVLNLLPRGTHHYEKFIRPSELEAGLRQAGLTLRALEGIAYNPLTRRARRTTDVTVNYLMGAVRD